MFNLDKLHAMGRMIANVAHEKAADEATPANDVISMASLLKLWKAGSMENPVEYAKNDVRTYNGIPWRCAIAHTHHGEAGWEPGSGNSLWFPYHATERKYALPYVMICAETVYNTGEWMIWTDGLAYMAKQDAVAYGPDALPDAWEVAAE